MKRFLYIIILLLSCYDSYAQINSYESYKDKMKLVFDMSFIKETTGYFIVSVTSETELLSRSIPDNHKEIIDSQMSKAFESAACKSCALLFKEKATDPIDLIYSNLELHRVFLIYKEKDEFYVEAYGDK